MKIKFTFFVLLLLMVGAAAPHASALTVSETNLLLPAPAGEAYDVNQGVDGLNLSQRLRRQTGLADRSCEWRCDSLPASSFCPRCTPGGVESDLVDRWLGYIWAH